MEAGEKMNEVHTWRRKKNGASITVAAAVERMKIREGSDGSRESRLFITVHGLK